MQPRAQFPDEQSAEGEFKRQDDHFRDWVSVDGSTPYPIAADRYHLYISLACPWASRTLIVRHLKGLQAVVGVTVVDPIRDQHGWAFREGDGYSRDPIDGFHFLSEAYYATDPTYRGRVTVPVLWDKETGKIVNNSEDDICRMFNDAFGSLGNTRVDLCPQAIETEHTQLAKFLYRNVNNGVYKSGLLPVKAPTKELVARCSWRWTTLKPGWLPIVISLVQAWWRRTGVCFARWFVSTPSITGTSNATSGNCRLYQSTRLPDGLISTARNRRDRKF